MRVKLVLVDGTVQFLEPASYAVSKVETMHPDILEVKVYTDHGRLLAVRRRKHWKHYIKYEYKPLPPEQPPAENQEPPEEMPST